MLCYYQFLLELQVGDDQAHVHPIVPPSVVGFAVDHVKVRGKILSIIWDRDGTMYNNFDQGLTVLLDGEKVAHSSTIELLVVQMNATRSTSGLLAS